MSSQKASTCCGKSDVCVCATQAKCSCGKQSALHCTCEKAATENSVSGARCSCRARPAGECNCDRAGSENVRPTGSACACGSRPAGTCFSLPSATAYRAARAAVIKRGAGLLTIATVL
ncbi:hypothetical protein RB594_007347 [Gaeumannomyces avenae]